MVHRVPQEVSEPRLLVAVIVVAVTVAIVIAATVIVVIRIRWYSRQCLRWERLVAVAAAVAATVAEPSVVHSKVLITRPCLAGIGRL